MSEGYVKDYRQSLDHPLFKRPLIWHFWVYCRLRANHHDNEIDFDGKPLLIKRGSFVMSLRKAEKETGLSLQNIRTAMKILENHGMIEKSTQVLTQKAHIITICNYEKWQGKQKDTNTETNTRPTQYQHSSNTSLTINNNDKNEDNEKEIYNTPKKQPAQKKYSEAFLKLWVNYPNQGNAKHRTYKNYNKTKSLLMLSDDDIYTACMNYVESEKKKGTDEKYIYKLSNLVGDNYRDILPDLLNMDPLENFSMTISGIDLARQN